MIPWGLAVIGFMLWSGPLTVESAEVWTDPPASLQPPLRPAPPSVSLTIARYFDDVETATRIAFCESTYDPSAQNPTSSAAGLFQITLASFNWAREHIDLPPFIAGRYHLESNVRAAAWLAQETPQGFGHWNPSRSCWG